MYKIGDYIVYRHDVCKIKNIKEINKNDYYIMSPIDDDSLTINIPVDNKSNNIRDLISFDEATKLVNAIPTIDVIEVTDEKNIENTYRQLINSFEHDDLVRIIKSTYLRNNNRIQNKKKISDKDQKYFELAEKYLYNELSVVFNESFEDTKKRMVEKFQEN